jgi:hypothetical protein
MSFNPKFAVQETVLLITYVRSLQWISVSVHSSQILAVSVDKLSEELEKTCSFTQPENRALTTRHFALKLSANMTNLTARNLNPFEEHVYRLQRCVPCRNFTCCFVWVCNVVSYWVQPTCTCFVPNRSFQGCSVFRRSLSGPVFITIPLPQRGHKWSIESRPVLLEDTCHCF